MFRQEMKEHLTLKLLPFWKNLKDDEFGGFYGWMDTDLKVTKEAVKGCILNNRILWFFSNAYLATKDETIKPYADHAYEFLKNYCFDAKKGGVFWALTYDGKVEDSTKHTYNQAFAVYALSSYYRAFGNEEAIELAKTLVNTIEEKCFDEYGYKEALDEDFNPVDNDKLSENGVMADRTMNTLLHVLEAYTEFYDVTKDQVAHDKLCWMLDMIHDHIYNPELHRQEVFFDNDMNSIIDLHSYGHDIETAWLTERTLEILGEEAYTKKLTPIIRDLENQIYTVAYNHHSLANECEKGVVNTLRIWWVQAESVVGFYNAFQKTGEERYEAAALDIWEFIKANVIDDREGGEWYWCTDEEGKPVLEKPIVEPWKCPYHNGRMCMEIMKRIAE